MTTQRHWHTAALAHRGTGTQRHRGYRGTEDKEVEENHTEALAHRGTEFEEDKEAQRIKRIKRLERLNDISGDILDAAIKIHRHFGPGMLESVYERLREAELTKRGHFVERQKIISFDYEGQTFDNAFRVDLLVDKEIVVELKATETMNKLYPMQVKTYLVAMNLHLGLLINFGMDKLVDGFVRIINGYSSSLSSPSSSSPSSPFPSSSPSSPFPSSSSPSPSPSSPSLCASVTSVPLCAKGAPL